MNVMNLKTFDSWSSLLVCLFVSLISQSCSSKPGVKSSNSTLVATCSLDSFSNSEVLRLFDQVVYLSNLAAKKNNSATITLHNSVTIVRETERACRSILASNV